MLLGFSIGERSATPCSELGIPGSIVGERVPRGAGDLDAGIGEVDAEERRLGLVATSAGGSEPASSHLILKTASPLSARSRGLGQQHREAVRERRVRRGELGSVGFRVVRRGRGEMEAGEDVLNARPRRGLASHKSSVWFAAGHSVDPALALGKRVDHGAS